MSDVASSLPNANVVMLLDEQEQGQQQEQEQEQEYKKVRADRRGDRPSPWLHYPTDKQPMAYCQTPPLHQIRKHPVTPALEGKSVLGCHHYKNCLMRRADRSLSPCRQRASRACEVRFQDTSVPSSMLSKPRHLGLC